MEEFPKISVLVSTYNSERFFRGKIEDLLKQTALPELEIIVVNSGSQENEEKILNEYLPDYPQIKSIITDERETLYRAWNRGIKASRGKYITNANTDDRLRKDALEILSRALDDNPDTALVYADQYITNVPNEPFEQITSKRTFKRQNFSMPGLLSGYLAGSQSMWRSVLHSRDDIWFDESFEVAGDYDFICRIAEKYPLLRVPGVIGSYYLSDSAENIEHRNKPLALEENYRVRLRYTERYLESLSDKERKLLGKKIERIAKIPKKVFSLARKTIEAVKHTSQIPPRIFYLWMGSVLEEREGNLAKAEEYLHDYADDASPYMIRKQLLHLKQVRGKEL